MNTRIFSLLFLLSALFTGGLNAQNTGAIEGVVTDENNRPISNLNVGLLGTTRGAATDNTGKFTLKDVKPGSYLIGVTGVGFTEQRREIEVQAGETLSVNFEMKSRLYEMPQVNILENREGIFENVPGSVTYINREEIETIDPVSGNEVFRRSPGVHAVEEEGLGMRANIGIRGLDPGRSRSVLMMEDGIPIALAPYGEPEMYYTPAMDRMEGVEILKGSGQVLYGPQTIGGVVNYITADPPQEQSGSIALRGGEGGFFTGMANFGNTIGKTGYNVNYLRKQGDNIGPTQFRIDDINAKFKFQLNNKSNLGLKIGIYDEESNSTYVGLTQPMFDNGEYWERIAPDDRLRVRRYSLSATHNYFLSNNTKITTTLFGYTTTRNWQRQDYAYNSFDDDGNLNPPPSNFTGVIWGDESLPGGAIYMRNSTGNRNRSFEVGGAESKITSDYKLGGNKHEFTAGVRFLYERAFEQRINGSKKDAPSGVLRDDEIRTGYGTSAYIHNKFNINNRFSVTAGVRTEWFEYERDIRRGRFDGEIRDTSIVTSTGLVEVIPGAGFNYQLASKSTLFGGVHRGFAPPRIKDAISPEGEAYELDAELSWNYEIGIRSQITKGLRAEITGFYMDFSNQILPVAEFAGGGGAGLINGGQTRHAGVEGAVFLNFGEILDWKRFNILYDANITYVNAEFADDRIIEEVEVRGNRTPYAPEWLISSALTFDHHKGAGLRFTGTYISEQFTDVGNSVAASNNGRNGLIPSYYIIDATARYKVDKINTLFTLAVKNLLDERYIVTRRPQGIRAGLPRMITAGIRYNF